MAGTRKAKRKKRNYLNYDYEEAYDKQVKSLGEDLIKQMLDSGRIKSIYATKEIRAGDLLEVEIYPEFTRTQRSEIPPPALKKKNQKAKQNLNDRNSRKRCMRLLEANFTDGDIWATLTYTNPNHPESMAQAKKNVTNYLKRLNRHRKKMGLSATKYICVTECSEAGRWHHHIALSGDIDLDTVERVWGLGDRNQVRRIARDENGLSGMANYITKDKRKAGKYQKSWTASRGLKKPKETKNHYKFKQKDVDAIIRGKTTVEDSAARWYGEKLVSYEIRYNDHNRRFYIHMALRKPKDQERQREKKREAG